IALRLALGASRRRIVVQLLTESVVLSAFGMAAGLVLAAWSIRLFVGISPTDVRGLDEVTIDGAVPPLPPPPRLLTPPPFRALPVCLGSRPAPRGGLDDGGRATAGRRHSRVRATLAVAETALGVVLLVGAGLLMRSFYRLAHSDPGFDGTHVLTAKFSLPDSR